MGNTTGFKESIHQFLRAKADINRLGRQLEQLLLNVITGSNNRA